MIIGIASADALLPHKSHDGKTHWGGAGWARCGQYIPYLEAAGHTVVVGVMWRYQGVIAIEETTAGSKHMVTPDVVIMQRLMHDTLADTVHIGRASGQVVFNDVDDYYWGLDHRNEAWKASHPKWNKEENTEFYWNTIMASNFLTVSTPFLADRMRSRGYRGDIHLIDNYVDVGRFTEVEQRDHPTFGWAGSTAHRSGDIEVLRGVFDKYLTTGDLKLHHSGAMPNASSFASRLALAEDKVSTQPGCPVPEYPGLMTMDVGLVPLRDCAFNEAKSDIKGLEYAAAGIPFIASNLPSYARLHEDWGGEGFKLAAKAKHWGQAVRGYLDKQARVDAQAALSELVLQRDIQVGAAHWLSLIESLAT